MYTCTVCGYPGLDGPPTDFRICVSCMTEFGYDDFLRSHADLRVRWMQEGLQWRGPLDYRPANWSPYDQLTNAGLAMTEPGHTYVVTTYGVSSGDTVSDDPVLFRGPSVEVDTSQERA